MLKSEVKVQRVNFVWQTKLRANIKFLKVLRIYQANLIFSGQLFDLFYN